MSEFGMSQRLHNGEEEKAWSPREWVSTDGWMDGCYKSPSDETINRGPTCAYAGKKMRSLTHVKYPAVRPVQSSVWIMQTLK